MHRTTLLASNPRELRTLITGDSPIVSLVRLSYRVGRDPSRHPQRTTIMAHLETLLQTHPAASRTKSIPTVAAALDSLAECVTACTVCADSCLGESEHLDRLRRCIRTDLDCADVCTATARLLSRQTETSHDLIRAQLHTCVLACRVCADECELHQDMHEHCRRCAEACRRCQESCNLLLGETGPVGEVESDDAESSSSPAYVPGGRRTV